MNAALRSRVPHVGRSLTATDVGWSCRGCFVLLLALALAPALHAQQRDKPTDDAAPVPPFVAFAFERTGLPVPKFALSIASNGAGSYQGEEVLPPARPANAPPPPQHFDRTLTVSAATAKKIFALAHTLRRFNFPCASNAKNIADTGAKTLTYTGPDGNGSCTYNYTENKNVQALTELFEGIAETMDEGRRLDFLHHYDRLGLDAEFAIFAQQVADGRALEVATIAPILRSLAEDPAVLQRVRTRAAALLVQGRPAP